MIDEFYIAAESYNRVRCDMVRRDVRPFDLLSKKAGDLHIACRWYGSNQRE